MDTTSSNTPLNTHARDQVAPGSMGARWLVSTLAMLIFGVLALGSESEPADERGTAATQNSAGAANDVVGIDASSVAAVPSSVPKLDDRLLVFTNEAFEPPQPSQDGPQRLCAFIASVSRKNSTKTIVDTSRRMGDYIFLNISFPTPPGADYDVGDVLIGYGSASSEEYYDNRGLVGAAHNNKLHSYSLVDVSVFKSDEAPELRSRLLVEAGLREMSAMTTGDSSYDLGEVTSVLRELTELQSLVPADFWEERSKANNIDIQRWNSKLSYENLSPLNQIYLDSKKQVHSHRDDSYPWWLFSARGAKTCDGDPADEPWASSEGANWAKLMGIGMVEGDEFANRRAQTVHEENRDAWAQETLVESGLYGVSASFNARDGLSWNPAGYRFEMSEYDFDAQRYQLEITAVSATFSLSGKKPRIRSRCIEVPACIDCVSLFGSGTYRPCGAKEYYIEESLKIDIDMPPDEAEKLKDSLPVDVLIAGQLNQPKYHQNCYSVPVERSPPTDYANYDSGLGWYWPEARIGYEIKVDGKVVASRAIDE